MQKTYFLTLFLLLLIPSSVFAATVAPTVANDWLLGVNSVTVQANQVEIDDCIANGKTFLEITAMGQPGPYSYSKIDLPLDTNAHIIDRPADLDAYEALFGNVTFDVFAFGCGGAGDTYFITEAYTFTSLWTLSTATALPDYTASSSALTASVAETMINNFFNSLPLIISIIISIILIRFALYWIISKIRY